jgi:hypothetical protein
MTKRIIAAALIALGLAAGIGAGATAAHASTTAAAPQSWYHG